MEIVFLSAKNTLSFVTLPDFQLHSRRNHPRIWESLGWGTFYDEIVSEFELKLEN